MNRERIERDTVLQVLALERDWSRAAYGEFGQWLLAEQPDKPNLAKVFASHFSFFARVDVSVSDPQALRGNGLLDMFNVAELRKHVLPVRFLGSHVGVALDESAKIEQIERSRIAEKLLASRHMPYAAVLQRYVGWLDEQGVPTRTIRLYLTAANQLCKVEGIGESGACEEAQLQHFLRSHPGSRASLFRWLTFGRSVLGWRLTMPRPRSGKHRLPRTVLDLSVLMKKIEQVGLERAPLKFLHRVIAKTFGFPVAHLSAHQWRVIEKGEEIYLSNERESIRVPEPMRHLVKVWADRVDATST